MFSEAIEIAYMPEMDDPVLIAGFEGWGNALDLSRGMVDYLIEKLDAKAFGRIVPDPFYRFDENRPSVEIEEGLLKKITPPGGYLHVVQRQAAGRDMILLKAPEPNLRWLYFAEALVGFCEKAKVRTIIILGSMYDNVLHTDTVISAVASTEELLARLKEKGLSTVNYKGPSAI
ncbi:MAG: PAC2 family protein, partial [Deltaproteobacteria bacterium]|nr:PAC2 family protein [Deltaproteobacteria bacterium]